jgi:spore germination protein YaaH
MSKKNAVCLISMLLFAALPERGLAKFRAPPPKALSISGWVVYWDMGNSLNAAREHSVKMEEISVFAADFDESGELTVYPEAADAIRELKAAAPPHPRILVSIVNDVRTRKNALLKNPDIIHDILSSADKTAAHIEQLLQISADADGIEIDYESLYLKDRDAFTAFIRDLAQALHERGKWLSVDVEPKMADVLKDREGAMDWKALGQHADNVKVMAYLYHYPSGDPGPLAPPDWVAAIAQFALSQIPAEKLSMALTMNGCDWGNPGQGKPLNHGRIIELAIKNRADIRRDPESASPYFDYAAGRVDHQVWFEDAESLKEKVKRLTEAGVLHVALWYLGSGDPAFLKGITRP